jgi:hypothetical protein
MEVEQVLKFASDLLSSIKVFSSTEDKDTGR